MDEIAVPELRGELAERIGQLAAFTEVWLANRRLSDNTRAAYRVDLRDWLSWCRRNHVDPIQAKFTHVNAWRAEMEDPPVGRAMAASTVARKMSAVSSWYAYLVKLGALAGNPATVADRPRVDRDHTSTVAFDGGEARRMAAAAETLEHVRLGAAAPVLFEWLVQLGTRATETCALNVGDLGYERGHRTVKVRGKGEKVRRRAVPAGLADILGRYLEGRFSGGITDEHHDLPLFADVRGHRIDRFLVSRFIRAVAKAASVESAAELSAHSTRHAFATISRGAGADLRDTQRAMGHADPRTTLRYEHTGEALERDPSLLVARAVARPDPAQPRQASVNDTFTGPDPEGGNPSQVRHDF